MTVIILYNINLTKKLLKNKQKLTGNYVSIHDKNYKNRRIETCQIINIYCVV